MQKSFFLIGILLFVMLSLAVVPSVYAQAGFVNTARQTFNAGSASVTLTGVASGNLLVIGFVAQHFAPGGVYIFTVTDTIGTTYSTCNPLGQCEMLNFASGQNYQTGQIYWGTTTAAATSIVVTAQFTNTAKGILEVSQYSGYTISSGLNAQNIGTTGSVTADSSISVSTPNVIQSSSITYALVGIQCFGSSSCTPSPQPVYTGSTGVVEDKGADVVSGTWHSYSAVGDSATATFSGSTQIPYQWEAAIIELQFIPPPCTGSTVGCGPMIAQAFAGGLAIVTVTGVSLSIVRNEIDPEFYRRAMMYVVTVGIVLLIISAAGL